LTGTPAAADRLGYDYAWDVEHHFLEEYSHSPEFHAMEPEHRACKEQVLNREIELEEIDTTPYRERIGVGKGVTIDRLVAAQ
jgi:hypothetical protein